MALGGTGFMFDPELDLDVMNLPFEKRALMQFFFSLLASITLIPTLGGQPLDIPYGGTGFSSDIEGVPSSSDIAGICKFVDFIHLYSLGDKPLSVAYGGTGKSVTLVPADIGAAASTHAAAHKTAGADAIAPADIGAAAATHAAAHKTGGSDVITAADIGACGDSDSRLSDSRTPLSHATTHEMGGTDALTPAGIGASPIGHTHAGYLEASFDDVTNYLTIGGKTFDLSSLVVP